MSTVILVMIALASWAVTALATALVVTRIVRKRELQRPSTSVATAGQQGDTVTAGRSR